jgi:uncharacterized integral membrane protein
MTDASQSEMEPEPGTTLTKPNASSAFLGHRTRPTRISAAWVGVIVGALVLVLLLVFILQNMRAVKISYFTATGTMPLGVALLLAAIAGVLLAGVVASLRIWQLRHRPTRNGKSGLPTAVEDQSLAERAA